jgi:hypothetical protein
MLSGALLGGLMMDFFQLSWAFPLGSVVMIICTGLFLVGTHARTAGNFVIQKELTTNILALH